MSTPDDGLGPALAGELEEHRVLGVIDRVEGDHARAAENAAGGSGVSSTFGCIPTGVQLMIDVGKRARTLRPVHGAAADFLGQSSSPARRGGW